MVLSIPAGSWNNAGSGKAGQLCALRTLSSRDSGSVCGFSDCSGIPYSLDHTACGSSWATVHGSLVLLGRLPCPDFSALRVPFLKEFLDRRACRT